MINIKYLKKHLGDSFVLTCLICTFIILVFFAFTYVFVGHNRLPIGWDTPYYLDRMRLASDIGIFEFMEQTGYYKFGYSLVTSFFVTAGVYPSTVEIIFPIILCIFLIIISGFLAKKYWKKEKISIFTLFFATTWFAVYRLGSDLHANLLALVLVLSSSYLFLMRFENTGKFRWLWSLPLLTIASFVHPETAVFFTGIFITSSIASYLRQNITLKYPLRKLAFDLILILLFVLPTVLPFFTGFSNLMTRPEEAIMSFPSLKASKWVAFMGLFFPLAIPLFFYSYHKNFPKEHCPLDDFVVAWTILAIVFALSHYVIPVMTIYSERILILFPTPFVFGLGLSVIVNNFPRKIIIHFNNIVKTTIENVFGKKVFSKSFMFNLSKAIPKIIKIVAISGIFISCFVLTVYYVKPTLTVFISPSGYNRLNWLSDNYHLSTVPIFVYNDYDQYAGAFANRHSNWVQAIYGDHYSYLGDIDSLLALKETQFNSSESRIYSRIFLEQMIRDGVFTESNLFKHQIIIINDFYGPQPIPQYTNASLKQVYDGVFIVQIEN